LIGQKPSRELTIEETLSWTFNLYSRNFITFFIPMLVTSLITGILSAIIVNYVLTIPQPSPYATPTEIWNWAVSFLVWLLLLAFTLGVLSWIVGAIASGVIVKCASDLIERGSTSLGEAFNFTISRLLSLLIGMLVSGILIGLGMIALIMPGIILSIMFSMVIPTIVIEKVGAIESLSRSGRLVSNRWLKTFLFFLIIGIIVVVISYIATLIVAPFGSFNFFARTTANTMAGIIAGSLITSIITSFILPIMPISMAVYYYSMLAREQQSLPPPPPPLL
jgi:hypothetical protein